MFTPRVKITTKFKVHEYAPTTSVTQSDFPSVPELKYMGQWFFKDEAQRSNIDRQDDDMAAVYRRRLILLELRNLESSVSVHYI